MTTIAMPGADAFGPAVLAGAVASFDSSVRRETQRLGSRWSAQESGVQSALDAMSSFETSISSALADTSGGLA